MAWILHNEVYPDDRVMQFKDYLVRQEPVATQSAAKAQAMQSTRVRRFILDSGASFHLIAKESLSDEERLSLRTAHRPILIRTAGGPEPLRANEVAEVWIASIQETVTAYILPDVMPLLSMIQIVELLPYYIVISKKGTHLIHEQTKARIQCEHVTGVPMLNTAQAMTGTQVADANGDVEPSTPAQDKEDTTNGNVEQKENIDANGDVKQQEKRQKLNKIKKIRKRRTQGKQMEKPLPGHNLITHFPKDPDCDVCRHGKPQRAQCRQKVHGEPDNLPEPKEFMDAVTVDTKVLGANKALEGNEKFATIFYDRATKWLQAWPQLRKTAAETVQSFQKFFGTHRPKHVYTDNADELRVACNEVGIVLPQIHRLRIDRKPMPSQKDRRESLRKAQVAVLFNQEQRTIGGVGQCRVFACCIASWMFQPQGLPLGRPDLLKILEDQPSLLVH